MHGRKKRYGKWVLPLLLTRLSSASGAELPNVVMIMADDWGWSDVAAYRQYQVDVMGHDLSSLGGTTPIPTPNIDRLCAEGMMFTDAYSAGGLCAPTRFSMMTGSNPYRNGMPGGTWMIHNKTAFDNGNRTEPHITVGEVAQAAGYRTAFFGKMHLGGGTTDGNEGSLNYDAKMPEFLTSFGFDYTFNVHDGIQADPYLYLENDRFVKIDPLDPLNPSTFGTVSVDTTNWTSGSYVGPNGTSVIQEGEGFWGIGDKNWDSSQNGIINSRKAAAFIGDHLADYPDQPFMMYYCAPQVHLPHTPPIDFNPNSDGTPHDPSHPDFVPVRDAFGYGNEHSKVIYDLDLQVGWIINKLEDPNGDGDFSDSILDNTLVMFTSDNGGLGTSYAAPGYDSTGVLQGFKGSSYEGGHRVPFVARWPGKIVPGSVSEQLIGGHDWVGLMYGLTETAMAADQAMDCVNILPTLLGEQSENVPLRDFMVLHRNATPYVMRQGDYVLFLDANRVPTQLYNLAADLAQENDLFDDSSEEQRISDMTALFKQHDDMNDPRSTVAYLVPGPPTPNPAAFVVEPAGQGYSSASMTSVSGAAVNAPVEYFFTETSGHEGGSSSGWQLSPTYTDDKLLPGLTYSYTVQMRDASNNVGEVSAAFDAPISITGNTVIFAEDFSAVAKPQNVTGAPPLNQWHMDGATYWQSEGWNNNPALGSVSIVDGTHLASALKLGWKPDNVEVRHVLSNTWDLAASYELTGDWEKITDSADSHLGFHVYLSEFSASGWVKDLKTLHVNPGNPAIGTTNRFTLSLSAADLEAAGANPANRIGIMFLRSEDTRLTNDVNDWSTKNDQFIVDNVQLVASGPAVSMFEQWLINYEVSGEADEDSDGDGMLNLHEFGLGGNPTNPASIGHLPVFERTVGGFRYIYPRRKNAGLNYWLETCTNLLSGIWTNSGYAELPEPGTIDADFEAVTNSLPVDHPQRFLRLLIGSP